MSISITNSWGEFKRRHPESAENIVTLFLQTLSVIIVVVCAYYALKFKPFQSFSLNRQPQAHDSASPGKNLISAHGGSNKTNIFPVKISLAPAQKKSSASAND
jgi:hypothetical protein